VVALDAPDSTLLERLGSASDRPLLRGDVSGRLAELRRRRQRAYAEAHLRIDTGRTSPEEAETAIRALAGAIPVPVAGSAYPVIVGEAAVANIEAHLPPTPAASPWSPTAASSLPLAASPPGSPPPAGRRRW